VEEMTTKRKQKHNLELPGNNSHNAFTILNNIGDDALIQTAKDLDISLASDDEGCRK
jgi:hypothetical protein